MALAVAWAQAALNDLESAAEFIARDSPGYASVLVRDARSAASSLDILSKRGRVVPEISDASIRELFVCNYRPIYQVTPRTIYILGFIHGSRDLWALWKRLTRRA